MKTKTFKTLSAFIKAIAPLVKKNRQNLILDTLERLGYVTKEITHSPYYKTSYKLRQRANPTQEDVEKVAAEANAI